MEPNTGMDTKKIVVVGILGFLVGFGVSYLSLSGTLFPRASLAPSSSQEGGTVAQGVQEGKVNNEAPEQRMVEGGDGSDVAKKIQESAQGGSAKNTGTPGVVAGNSISVSDQSAGGSITLAAVSLDKRGWAVIHQDERGAPGWVLGARRLEPGQYTNETVELLRATTPGTVYYAMLHSDDGIDTFDLHKDLPITDASGNPVMMRFRATGE